VPYGLRRVIVRFGWGKVRAINLASVIILEHVGSSNTRSPTRNMASLTRSDRISLFFTRLVIRASLVAPELRQAMLRALLCAVTDGGLKKREGPRTRLNLAERGTVESSTRGARRMEMI